CIFCDKTTTKFKGKTEELKKFQSWKHKEPAWKVIEPRAQELKKEDLYRKVQGKDLFAMEAQYHPICRNNFNNEYQNHERGRKRGKKAADNIDSPQARKMAAHDKSYCVVKDYILRNVVEHKEVVQLRSMCNLYRKTLEGEGFPNPEYRMVTGTLDEEKCEKMQRLVYSITQDVCRAATNSKWKLPKHILLCATLRHLYRSKQVTMNYMGRLTGRKCLGAGYAEILIEAGLANSGCLKNILSGKSYAKALFSLKAVTEALERLLFNVFLEEEKPDIPYEILFNLIHSCTSESLNSTLKDPTLLKLIGDYLQYQDKVRRGHLGKTGMFWLSMMDHARLVFMMDFAVKTNNLSCSITATEPWQISSLRMMATTTPGLLTNIDLSHPGALDYIKLGAIAVARSLIPGALAAVDKTMEETFMRFAKTSGGLLGFFNNCGAYQKWCRTTSARAQLYELTLEMCGMIDDPEMPKAGKHRELEPAQIKKSELAVQSVISAINGFTNPWRILDKSRLYSLASGAPIDPEVEADVLRAEAAGRAAKEQFIQERFISKRNTSLIASRNLGSRQWITAARGSNLHLRRGSRPGTPAPPKVCLIPHVQRANYRVAFYKRADKAIIESPKPHDPGMGWEKTGEEGVLEPVWAIGPILPPYLVEVLAQRAESEEHAALDKVTDYANNNLSVGEVDGEYEHEDEELEMEEI
ncbi:hypothetical protein F7725_021439, partial [Dissostichus mawsoni]